VLAGLRQAALDAHLAASRRYAARFAYERAFEACRRAAFFTSDPKEMGQVEQTLGDARAAQGDADEAWTHYLRARACCREAGLEPPADLYPSLLELPGYTSGMFRQLPDGALVEALLLEGERVARGAGDAASVARLLALRAYASNDAAQISEALRISETVVDPIALGSFLEHTAILQIRLGDFAAAQRSYERLDSLAPSGVSTDRQLEFRAILALNMGHLDEAQHLAARYLAVSASRGPHLRTHAYREQCHVLLSRGDWRSLRQLAADTEKLVSEHKETAFCYAVTTAFAFAAVAAEIGGEHEEAGALLARAEVPLQAELLERESVLLLASGALGRSDKVMELRRMVHQRSGAPLWYFNRAEAAALIMLERWDEAEEALLRLEPFAVRSASSYISALTGAVGEEIAAARGGPSAAHRELMELGYLGWSQLLSHRPKA
jgi:tetratricopeptide (TPR) repeat protein